LAMMVCAQLVRDGHASSPTPLATYLARHLGFAYIRLKCGEIENDG
jgi:hypothetical protein